MTELSIAQKVTSARTEKAGKTREQYYAEIRAKRTHVCLYCKNEYVNKRRHLNEGNKFCSRRCSDAHKRDIAKPKYSKVFLNTCVVCATEWVSRRKTSRPCSVKCVNAKARHDYRVAFEREVSHRYEKVCRECSQSFRPLHAAMQFCSKECSARHTKRNAKAVRRARLRGAEAEIINVVDVFKRDKWKCRCCGIKTPWTHRGTIKPTAPELDHILPLSEGGKHIKANVQLLCRRCNNVKANGSANDQMLLFG